MDNVNSKKIWLFLLLGLFSNPPVLWAQDQLQTDLAQFENWLKNNGQTQLLPQNNNTASDNSALQIFPGAAPDTMVIPPPPPSPRSVKRPKVLTYEDSQKVILDTLPAAAPSSAESS